MGDESPRTAGRPGPGGALRPVWAEIDLDALAHNVALLRRVSAPARLCAVVKADAYGHGALPVAHAALEAGADWLAVALVEEGVALRDAGVEAPVLLLSEPPPDALAEALAAGLTPTLYTADGVAAAAGAARGRPGSVGVHLKVDTGMHRVGADPADAADLGSMIDAEPGLRLQGLWTHLAVADDLSPGSVAFTAGQLARLEDTRAELAGRGVVPDLVHAANSAGAIAHRAARLDLVRCGIALYGEPPAPEFAAVLADDTVGGRLRPVLSLRARVSFVRDLPAGERVSYGLVSPLPDASRVATVPIGYADGVPRQFFTGGGTVLIGGRRCPVAGTVTMDQIVVECGSGAQVAAGDEVVLIGRQGVDELTAGDWAQVIGTISYEVLSGIGPRVPRVVVGGRAAGVRAGGGTGEEAP
jgi:alanine racemase